MIILIVWYIFIYTWILRCYFNYDFKILFWIIGYNILKSILSRTENSEAEKEFKKRTLKSLYMLSVAYSANLGGTGFPTGTGPNMVFWGIMER